MANFRSLTIATFTGALLALGTGAAFAQSASLDNTSPGESGHGTGCSNEIISGGGGDTNCQHSAAHSVDAATMDPGNMNGGTVTSIPSGNNPDNTSPGESGHGTGCSTPSTRTGAGVNGDTNCSVGSGSN